MKFKLHRVFEGKDEVIGQFEVVNNEIVYPSSLDESHCDMFPPGPISGYTKHRMDLWLDHPHKTMYLEKVK